MQIPDLEVKISKYKINKFRKGIREWEKHNGLRKYPWRETKDPFQLFITEILLRRTRSDSVAKIWPHFFSKYKSFNDFLKYPRIELQNDIMPLGLAKMRSQILIDIANIIKDQPIPIDENQLLKIPGVGKYIARMFLLMYKNRRGLIYDTNFRTVYSRYFGIKILRDLKRDPVIEQISELVIPKRNIKKFMLTILDFAALTCKPNKPLCDLCFLSNSCNYYKINNSKPET